AGYAFNKAHSVSYATIAYQTAFLKANYPAEYMNAVLIMSSGQLEKTASAIAECHRLGIEVLPPCINHSSENFAIERVDGGTPTIRFGLAAIKNVGAAAVRPLVAAREEGGCFQSIEDLCRRADIRSMNKRVLESLIKAGSLDCIGNRGVLTANIDRIVSVVAREQRLRESGQSTMFDFWGEAKPVSLPGLDLADVELPLQEKLDWEKELLGVYMSEHPFSRAASRLAGKVTALCGQIGEEMAGQNVVVAGIVASVRQMFTKDHRSFAAAVLEDLEGSVEVTAWPEVYEQTRELWVPGSIVLIAGRVSARKGRVQLVCKSAALYLAEDSTEDESAVGSEGPWSEERVELPRLNGGPAEVDLGRTQRLHIRVAETDDVERDVSLLRDVFTALKEYPGQEEVHLAVSNGGDVVTLKVVETRTTNCPALRQRLEALLGQGCVSEEYL
ncbi:MAG: OB-fold nucleic acid binding domain-containing protein, partial [Chloroflexota bacterium]